jgi:hypothetical protein
MTFEHKLLVGLGEIKAIVFECNECKSRMVLSPEDVNKPPATCPRGHHWDWDTPSEHHSFDSPFPQFLSALKRLREPMRERVGFRLLLEFEGQKT